MAKIPASELAFCHPIHPGHLYHSYRFLGGVGLAPNMSKGKMKHMRKGGHKCIEYSNTLGTGLQTTDCCLQPPRTKMDSTKNVKNKIQLGPGPSKHAQNQTMCIISSKNKHLPRTVKTTSGIMNFNREIWRHLPQTDQPKQLLHVAGLNKGHLSATCHMVMGGNKNTWFAQGVKPKAHDDDDDDGDDDGGAAGGAAAGGDAGDGGGAGGAGEDDGEPRTREYMCIHIVNA